MPELYLPARFHIPSRRKFLECELDVKCMVSAKYKVQIVRDGKVIREPFGDKWLPNLIVNLGLDTLFSGTNILNAMNAVRAGTSATAPTNADTNLNAHWGGTATATGSGASSTNDTVNGAVTHTQSYDFAAAASGVSLNEIGLASNTANAANLTTHALFPSTVTLSTGDVLRVAYTMTWSIPATATAVPISLAAINGFNISGSMKVCGTFANIFGALNAAGTWTTSPTTHYIFGGAAGNGAFLCSAPTTFPSVNTGLSVTTLGNNITSSLGTYTNGSFTRNQTFVWVPSNPSTPVSNVNGMTLNGQNQITCLYLLLSAAQTKANTNTLTVITTCTLARA